MLVYVREALLDGTFADNLKLLQSYPPVDFHVIFKIATDLHEHRWRAPPSKKSRANIQTTTTYTHASVTPSHQLVTAHLPSFTLPFSTKKPHQKERGKTKKQH